MTLLHKSWILDLLFFKASQPGAAGVQVTGVAQITQTHIKTYADYKLLWFTNWMFIIHKQLHSQINLTQVYL